MLYENQTFLEGCSFPASGKTRSPPLKRNQTRKSPLPSETKKATWGQRLLALAFLKGQKAPCHSQGKLQRVICVLVVILLGHYLIGLEGTYLEQRKHHVADVFVTKTMNYLNQFGHHVFFSVIRMSWWLGKHPQVRRVTGWVFSPPRNQDLGYSENLRCYLTSRNLHRMYLALPATQTDCYWL